MEYFDIETSDSNEGSKNCTRKYLIDITQSFLNVFGTDTIPDGYVEGGDYGKRYKNQDFAELFTIFYILIIVAVLCLLALLVMIVVLIWLKHHDAVRTKCKHLNRFSIFLLLMLLLLLILMTFPLYITIKNGWDLRNRIESQNSNNDKAELDRLVKIIDNKTNHILISDYENMKNEALSAYDDIPIALAHPFTNTSSAIRMAKRNIDKFDQFMVDYIEEEFQNVLFFDDAYRTISRNTTAYVGYLDTGEKIIRDYEVARYYDFIYTLEQWATYYQQANAVSKLNHYYAHLKPKPVTTAKQKEEIRQDVKNYLDDRGLDAKLLNDEIGKLLKSGYRKREKNSPVAIITNFALIMCFIAIVVLIPYIIILLYSLCKKRNRNRALVKPLTVIYVILTILFEVMAFAFFFPFFYGVIDYNTICNKTENKQSTKSFYNLYVQCKDDEKIYNLMMNNKLIKHPLPEWQTMTTSNFAKICNSSCSPLNFTFVNETYYDAKLFPKSSDCKHKIPTDPATRWRNAFYHRIASYTSIGDQDDIQFYYWNRRKFSACNLDYSKKVVDFQVDKNEVNEIFPPYSSERTDECHEGHKLANKSMVYIGASVDEISKMCKKNHDECLLHVDGASKVQQKVSAYQLNADKSLREEIGSCRSTIMRLSKERRSEFCNCDTNMLNGIWVGCLLFLIGLFISLMLLPCLICIYKNCNNDRPRRSIHASESIVLPPVVLPKTAINMIRASPDPQVSYMVKKKMR